MWFYRSYYMVSSASSTIFVSSLSYQKHRQTQQYCFIEGTCYSRGNVLYFPQKCIVNHVLLFTSHWLHLPLTQTLNGYYGRLTDCIESWFKLYFYSLFFGFKQGLEIDSPYFNGVLWQLN